MSEHSRAIRAMQLRTKKEGEERRERQAIIDAQLAWERDREARTAREFEQRQCRWAELVQAVLDCDDELALNKFTELSKEVCSLLASPVALDGATLLHLSVSRALHGVIEAILEKCSEAVKYTDADGQTPLHRAAAVDSSGDLVRMLAEHIEFEDLERMDGHGRTPLEVARHWGLPEAAQALMEAKGEKAGAVAEATAERARKAEEAAARAREARTVKAKFPGVGHMAGIDAMREGRYEDAMALIAERTWVFTNVKDECQRTLLHYAAARGRADICEALLVREDFTVDAHIDKDEATALHVAAAGEKVDCCRAIVTVAECRFSGINVLDARRRTALHLAALRGNAECYEAILLHPVCHTGLPDFDGKTAAEYAVERGIDAELPEMTADIDL